jgi:hypothetical protein
MNNLVRFFLKSSIFPKRNWVGFWLWNLLPKESSGLWILLTSAKPTSLARCCRIPAAQPGSIYPGWEFPAWGKLRCGESPFEIGNSSIQWPWFPHVSLPYVDVFCVCPCQTSADWKCSGPYWLNPRWSQYIHVKHFFGRLKSMMPINGG